MPAPASSEPSTSTMPPPPSDETAATQTLQPKIEPDSQAMSIDQTEGDGRGGGEKGPTEVIDVDEEKPPTLDFSLAPPPQTPLVEEAVRAIDVPFEASKLPLDVAIFNSARAAGGDDKIRKYLQAVLVIGGTALIPGMAHALESRCVLIYLYTPFPLGVFAECVRLLLLFLF